MNVVWEYHEKNRVVNVILVRMQVLSEPIYL